MHIPLTPELEQLIYDKVNSGRYPSAGEVIREGLRLLDERDRLAEKRLTELKQKIQIGIEELDRGLGIDGDTVFVELELEIQQAEAQIQLTEESA
ncbi:type II toxin-antitoxin system ParD family antitoxin [Nostoc sp. MG11]|uniref:type II toxin-antitoxin system ParD family antitoxin n=1 Tax=Nostoc sp. MG11 TaxID=2721166 RepID=UPI0018675B13|nr:type II toxin-antitoxin system ParD family antitoxin [Nostoc sp. MG11]